MNKRATENYDLNYFLKYKYKITIDQYNQLLENQNGCCAICKSNHSKNKRYSFLFVDHCHRLDVVRGLLCTRCNSGLGMFNDDTNLLNSAITYLLKYSNNENNK